MRERMANMYESSWPFILQMRYAREVMNGENSSSKRESMKIRET